MSKESEPKIVLDTKTTPSQVTGTFLNRLQLPLIVNVENDFEQREEARKLRLIQVLSPVMALIQFSAALFYIGFWFVLNEPATISGSIISFVLGISSIISSRLKTGRHYRLKAWLVVGGSLILVMYGCWLSRISISLVLMFMLPLALALALLSYREVILVAGFIIVISIGWYTNQTWLNWVSPKLILDLQLETISNIAIVVLVIPSVVALLLIPARSQLQMLRSQNQRLEKALAQLQLRQQTGQTVSQQVLAVASQLTTTANQQADGSQEQAAVVIQVDNSLTELSATANNIAELAEQVNQAAHAVAANSSLIEETTHLTARQSIKGLSAVQETVSVTSQSASLYQQLVDTMEELNLKNVKLRQILDLLGTIAGETHLLALNAAIEAASAGEYGERFSIIAQEVKRLARRSATANQEVLDIVAEIETASNSAVMAAQNGYQHAQQVEAIAHRTGTVMEEIGQIARQAQTQANSISQTSHGVKELTQVIWAATTQQRTASEQVLQALKGLSVVAEQSAEGSSFISMTANELEELSQHLNLALIA